MSSKEDIVERAGPSIGPFAVTKEMVAALGDEVLRELLGKLLEAEAGARAIASSSIDLGGNQTAADGGVDAVMCWEEGPEPSGWLPRRTLYFQCKATKMSEAAITKEMCPKGAIRPIFTDLARCDGSYIIFSTDDPGAEARKRRVTKMRSVLGGLDSADRIHLDFWGADAIARWTNKHVGVALWLLAKSGRPLTGWQPFGSWSSDAASGKTYLLDETARVKIGQGDQSVAQAIGATRGALSIARCAVRLVGMSGMGKTRLAEALFDARLVGGAALNPSLAIYADAGLELAIGAAEMAEKLVQSGIEALLVVDNCTDTAHRQLVRIVRQTGSHVRLLTIDYDVGDEQPEETLVVRLTQNSEGLLSNLLQQRAPDLSESERSRLAEFSGGNARIALAVARNSSAGVDLSKLNDSELLDRLFQTGRGKADKETRRTAEIASLVWAFYVEDAGNNVAEHPVLAEQAGLSSERFFEHVSTLLEWGVAQQRGPQRAILPPPLANRLAAAYLKVLDINALRKRFEAAPLRLFQSMTRRLGQLHDESKAAALANALMAAGGRLGDLAIMSAELRPCFGNAAPANPVAALTAIERAVANDAFVADDEAAHEAAQLLAHIAYDPPLFERALKAMLPLALLPERKQYADSIKTLFLDRFRPVLSMTLADGATRLAVVDHLLAHADPAVVALGVEALDHMLDLQANSSFLPEWGSKNRNTEWRPRLAVDETNWFGAAIERLLSIIDAGASGAGRARTILASHLREYCDRGMSGMIIPAMLRAKPPGYWEAGWREAQEAMHFAARKHKAGWLAELAELEHDLRPKTREEAFEAFVLGEPWRHWHPQGRDSKHTRNIELLAKAAGVWLQRSGTDLEPYLRRAVAASGHNSTAAFGEGLARWAPDLDGLWDLASTVYQQAAAGHRDVGVVIGILHGADRRDPEWANRKLDQIAANPAFAGFLVHFHGGRALDAMDAKRLSEALRARQVTSRQLGPLMYGGKTKTIPAAALANLLDQMADAEGGLLPALEVLAMRIFGDRQDKQAVALELLASGHGILANPKLYDAEQSKIGHDAGTVARQVLRGVNGEAAAIAICRAMKHADSEHKYWSTSDWGDLAKALMAHHPRVVLDEIGNGHTQRRRKALLSLFFGGMLTNDVDNAQQENTIDPEPIIAWVSEAPAVRAQVIAQFVPYARQTDDNGPLEWTGIALQLIDLAPDPPKVLNCFESRFESGVSSGPFWTRYERRIALVRQLSSHHRAEVRGWAAKSAERLKSTVAYWRDRERMEESLFE